MNVSTYCRGWDFSYFRTLANNRAIITVEIIVTNPGRMKLWLSRYFPIFVVPV